MDDEEVDMFTDLEKTLCEGLSNLDFTQGKETKSPDLSGIDVTCLEDVSNLNKINGPAVRAYNLWKASKAYQDEKYLDSIYFESFAMSLYMRIRFHANKIMEPVHHLPTEKNIATFLEGKKEEKVGRPETIDYIDRFLKRMLDTETTSHVKNIEFNSGSEMMKLCEELPNEWTVIQLCKQINPEVYLETRDETLKHPRLIFLTLIRYPWSERFDHRPIKIDLNQDGIEELYQASYEIFKRINSNDYYYFENMRDSEFEETIVMKIKKLLGPWIVCFSGKSRSMSMEKKAIDEVDRFLANSKEKYSKRQNALICLIARRVYMITIEDIKQGSLEISKTKEQFWELMDFFEELKTAMKSSKIKNDFYPVILIVDELIDFMYWEMCNPTQEFTRVDSIVLLWKLYFNHQDNISDGYFKVKTGSVSAVINPDRSLTKSRDNVVPLLKHLEDSKGKGATSTADSKWKLLVDKEPTFTDLRPMLADSAVYVYCGHGSGLQFISSYETCQLTTDAVVFLMGCSSVAFRANHGCSMGTAAHHYYHFAKSPAVIGNINLTYGSFCDSFMLVMLAKWFSPTKSFDRKIFRYDESEKSFAKKMNLCIAGPDAIQTSPYLSRAICQWRQKDYIPPVFRAIIVHRGLPVKI